jgi:hypothetical protein
MSPYEMVAESIILGQQRIMGDVAYSLAGRVKGLCAEPGQPVTIDGEGPDVIDDLVSQYAVVSGPLGVRMCFGAAQKILLANPDLSVPVFASLR